ELDRLAHGRQPRVAGRDLQPGRLRASRSAPPLPLVAVEGVAMEARRHPGRVLLATLPLQFAFGLVYCWGALAPYVERSDHWPALLLSAVFSATPVGYGIGIVVGGRLADRVPPRR